MKYAAVSAVCGKDRSCATQGWHGHLLTAVQPPMRHPSIPAKACSTCGRFRRLISLTGWDRCNFIHSFISGHWHMGLSIARSTIIRLSTIRIFMIIIAVLAEMPTSTAVVTAQHSVLLSNSGSFLQCWLGSLIALWACKPAMCSNSPEGAQGSVARHLLQVVMYFSCSSRIVQLEPKQLMVHLVRRL